MQRLKIEGEDLQRKIDDLLREKEASIQRIKLEKEQINAAKDTNEELSSTSDSLQSSWANVETMERSVFANAVYSFCNVNFLTTK